MHLHRAIYLRVAEIVNRREPVLPGSVFFEFFTDTYATTQATAIRRQAERGSRVASLGTLLGEIQAEPERCSRRRFVGAWPPDDQPRGQQTYSVNFAGSAGDHIDPAIVAKDAARLQEDALTILEYVDRHVAHTDLKPVKDLPTLKEVHAAIDVIGETFTKYALLLTGDSYWKLEPDIQGNWEAIFELPWKSRVSDDS